MYILGVQKQSNGNISLLKDGELVVYLLEERLVNKKNAVQPFHSITRIKEYTNHIDVVVFTGYSSIKTENYMFFSMLMQEGLVDEETSFWVESTQPHHIAHVGSAFYNSGFDEAVCIVWDGRGSDFEMTNGHHATETTSAYYCKTPNSIKPIYKKLCTSDIVTKNHYITDVRPSVDELKYPLGDTEIDFTRGIDIGLMYFLATDYIGFGADECGKTMGLAPYGKEDPTIPDIIISNGEYKTSNRNLFDGRYRINNDLYPNLDPKNFAYKLQKQIEEYCLWFVEKMIKKTDCKNIILTGGVALNVCANYYIRKNLPSDVNLYVEPNCEDTGNSYGIAKFYYHENINPYGNVPLNTLYLGQEPNYDSIDLLEGETIEDVDAATVAKLIAGGNIVCIFQGRSEAGPRALGNRSILFDPRVKNGKDIVNGVKRRESFRPFAASILLDDVHDWFDMAGLEESPFMMYAVDAKEGVADIVPSVIHVDNTCRIQTVKPEDNQKYYELISAFKDLTDVPMLFNTSFNLAGDPIVETVDHALRTLRKSEMEFLYLADLNKLVRVPK